MYLILKEFLAELKWNVRLPEGTISTLLLTFHLFTSLPQTEYEEEGRNKKNSPPFCCLSNSTSSHPGNGIRSPGWQFEVLECGNGDNPEECHKLDYCGWWDVPLQQASQQRSMGLIDSHGKCICWATLNCAVCKSTRWTVFFSILVLLSEL